MTGSGTIDDPYVVSATGEIDISDAITFADTETVNFTVTGAGTETDPWTVRADAALGVGDLTDVTCDAPADNDVLTWNGTAWTCAPVSATPGAINTQAPITGDGTVADPIGLNLVTDDTLIGSGTAADPLGWEIVYAAGTALVPNARPMNPGSLAVTFPAGRFTDTPFMTLGMYTGHPGDRHPGHIDKTPNGFTMMAAYTGASTSVNVWISWHAFVRPGEGDNPNPDELQELARLNPHLDFRIPPLRAEEDGMATCHVIGCSNRGIPIPVHTNWTDEDGQLYPIDSYACGVCGQPITDVEGIS